MRSTFSLAFAASIACPVLMAAGAVHGQLPEAGDHRRAEPGQPICFDFYDLLEYIILSEKGGKRDTALFGHCEEMLNNQEYMITYLSGESNPGANLAKVEARGPSNLLLGWTVIYTRQ